LRTYPALDVQTSDPDLLYPALDDFTPTAIEERENGLRAFFTTSAARDAALVALSPRYDTSAIDVPDEDWARRSQDNLQPITVGRIVVAPPWSAPSPLSPNPSALSPEPSALRIVVLPSMGFGTGHHATTRLCLAAMQELDLAGKAVLDAGTGSGVLAIAADRLGAARSMGIDFDPDAIQSARENLLLNPDATRVTFEVSDLATGPLPSADVVTANLTGALLVRSTEALLAATNPGGLLVLSGLMQHERDDVGRAFAEAAIVWERREDEWVGLVVKKR
jgi:ribosomal protein L11 methyltransferase